MTNTPPPQLGLSLPHILQDVAYWVIKPNDLAACVLVNRTWHDAITPVLWRYFFLNNPSREISPTLQQAIDRNAHHIQYLDGANNVLLDCLGPMCANIRALSYSPSNPGPSKTGWFGDFLMFLVQQRHSGKFVELNTALAPLRFEEATRYFMAAIPDTVRKLELHSSRDQFPQVYYRPEGLVAVLQSCVSKRQLQYLSISVQLEYAPDFHRRFQSDATFRNRMRLDLELGASLDHQQQQQQQQQQEPNTFTLKVLILKGSMVGVEDSILFPLLQLCPNLECFIMPMIHQDKLNDMTAILTAYCPRLRNVDLHHNRFSDEQVTHLIDVGIQEPLDGITIAGNVDYNTGRRVMQMSELGTRRAISAHSATLVTLLLHDCGLAVTSQWIQLLLVQCSRLKALLVSGTVVCASPHENAETDFPRTRMGRRRRALVGLDAMDIIHGEPWTCTDLELLELVIRNVPRTADRAKVGIRVGMEVFQGDDMDEFLIHETPPVMTDAESRFVQQQICQRIGSLKRLKALSLGRVGRCRGRGYCDDLNPMLYVNPIQHHCLELTLETGLDALAGLKRLQRLEMWGLDNKFGSREVEWMVREDVWPELQTISKVHDGILLNNSLEMAKYFYFVAKYQVGWSTCADNPAEWLRRERPSLSVNFQRRIDGKSQQFH
ncbi:hypothetical protein CPB97_000735 [Podila verticillata]|nr:hypothetical protein CPB97_000735 [Podila verticillata]